MIYRYSEGRFLKNLDNGGIDSLTIKKRYDYCYGCIFLNKCFGVWRYYLYNFSDEPDLINNISLNIKYLKDIKISFNHLIKP